MMSLVRRGQCQPFRFRQVGSATLGVFPGTAQLARCRSEAGREPAVRPVL